MPDPPGADALWPPGMTHAVAALYALRDGWWPLPGDADANGRLVAECVVGEPLLDARRRAWFVACLPDGLRDECESWLPRATAPHGENLGYLCNVISSERARLARRWGTDGT